MSINYRPETPRNTFESVDPLDAQWDYLEDVTLPTTDNFNPTSSQGSPATITPITAVATIEAVPMDARKREYILYSRIIVRRHINTAYSQCGKNIRGAETFSGPQLVTALIRVGKRLDKIAKTEKMGAPSSVALWHAVQYALGGEFITMEQATIRGCGPDAIAAPPSASSSPSLEPYSCRLKRVEGEFKRAMAKRIHKSSAPAKEEANLSRIRSFQNLNTFSGKLLRMGSAESAIKEYFDELSTPWNTGNGDTTTSTTTTPRCTPPIIPVSGTTPCFPPASCRKPDTGTLPRALHSPGNEFTSRIPLLPFPNFVLNKMPLSQKMRRTREIEPTDPKRKREFKPEKCFPLLRTRRMLSWESSNDKSLAVWREGRKLPPEPKLVFMSRSELDAFGASGVLGAPRICPDKMADWGQLHLEEQRNRLMAALKMKATISWGKVRRVPLPGSTSIARVTFPGPPTTTSTSVQHSRQNPLLWLSQRGVESIMADLTDSMSRLSGFCQVFPPDQPSTPDPATYKAGGKLLAQLAKGTAKVTSNPPPIAPSSLKRKLSAVADVESLENQDSLRPQKRLKAEQK
ncbi:hypothetical protein L873DRAFT_1813555 [Choiromyces venosus 120613-1]|uniref:Uncharacterized protein n=1 Tax=Choiromyces venosus 120613-1 TaxID=1336337 RepID=A0A3N4J9J7_9PEZI|nr:hypothetical protein L873DRAFT_1813555 [Choiromyces venosus 120613-1]